AKVHHVGGLTSRAVARLRPHLPRPRAVRRGLLLITGDTSTRYFVDLMHRAGQSWLATGLLMHYVILVHFVGGAMLAFGFLTRLAALVQIPVLAGAVFLIHRKDGLLSPDQSLEFSALVLFLLGVIF